MSQPILLYDFQRDKDLKVREAILVFEDGKTRKVRESSLYQKEEHSIREPIIKQPSSIKRAIHSRKYIVKRRIK